MFGMIVGAGLKLLESVSMNRRNMVVIALSLAIGLGLKAVPESVKLVPESLQMLLTSGLLPSAFLAVVLNIILPKRTPEGSSESIRTLAPGSSCAPDRTPGVRLGRSHIHPA